LSRQVETKITRRRLSSSLSCCRPRPSADVLEPLEQTQPHVRERPETDRCGLGKQIGLTALAGSNPASSAALARGNAGPDVRFGWRPKTPASSFSSVPLRPLARRRTLENLGERRTNARGPSTVQDPRCARCESGWSVVWAYVRALARCCRRLVNVINVAVETMRQTSGERLSSGLVTTAGRSPQAAPPRRSLRQESH